MTHPNSVAEKALAYIEMIATHLYKPTVSHRCESNSSVPKWSPPPIGSVMINIDAAIFSSSRSMGISVVIRDHMGQCLTTCSERLEGIRAPEIAEAIALRRAITLAMDEGVNKVVFQSDCLSVVQRVNSMDDDRFLCGPIMKDTMRMMTSFPSCSVVHVLRSLNVAAHSIAKHSDSLGCRVWRSVTLDYIREIICNDSLIV
jgi:hypothetical protein